MDLITARLRVRDVTAEDTVPLTDMWTDAEVARFMDDWGPRTVEAVPVWVEATMAANAAVPRTSHNCAIEVRASGAVAGWIGCGGSRPLGDWSFGYALRPAHRQLGYAREALVGVLSFCFAELGVPSVWGSCHRDNNRSAGVMLGAGMTEFEPSGDGERRFRAEGSWRPPDLSGPAPR